MDVQIGFDRKGIAINLRKQGFSLKEIAGNVKVSKSTASLWLKNVNISDSAQKLLEQKQLRGRSKALLTKKLNQEKQLKIFQQDALETLKIISNSRSLSKIF